MTLHRVFGLEFYLAGIALVVQNVSQFVPPVLLRLLISCTPTKFVGFVVISNGNQCFHFPAHHFVSLIGLIDVSGTDDRDWYGYVVALGMFGAVLMTTLSENVYFDCGCRPRSLSSHCVPHL